MKPIGKQMQKDIICAPTGAVMAISLYMPKLWRFNTTLNESEYTTQLSTVLEPPQAR